VSVAQRRAMGLVGRDMARARIVPPPGRKLLPGLLVGLLIAGLALAALRIDLIRVRYGLATAMREEKELLEEQRGWIARVRELRDPTRLSTLAAEKGFDRPQRVIELRP
jgi:hypothetical protein